jgi:hypothetical protein
VNEAVETDADERAQVAAAARAERKADEPAPPEAKGPDAAPGAAQADAVPDLDLSQVARLVVEGVDLGAKWLGGPHVAADEDEKQLLTTYTAPVLKKWLPDTLQTLSPEQALLAAVLIVYGSKFAAPLIGLGPKPAPSAEKPAEKEVKGEATVTPAGPPA